jgi:phospholipid/cholesterol/gamma-HCH transport system substrate-binding protein
MKTRWIDTLVGLVLLGAIAVFAVSKLWLSRAWEEGKSLDISVLVDDAKGLKGAEEVRMAGFQVGSVKGIRLAEPDYRRAIVTLRLERQYRIPADSKISISSAVLGGTPYVTIVPGSADARPLAANDTVEGKSSADLNTLVEGAGKLVNDDAAQADLKATLHNVRVATEGLARLTGDTRLQGDLRLTARNVRLASEQLPSALRQVSRLVPEVERQLFTLTHQTQGILSNIDGTTASAQRSARQAEQLAGDLRATVKENRGAIRALLRSANDAASGVAALTETARGVLGDNGIQKNLAAATGNLEAVSANFVALSKRLDNTAASIERLAGDEQLSGDIKATVGNLRETSQSVRNLAARVEGLRLPGERRRPAPETTPTPPPARPARRPTALLEPGLTFDSVYDTKAERFRQDAAFTLLSGRGSFYRLGLFDATGSDRLSLQAGSFRGLPASSALRYGVIAGKLGIGADLRTGPLAWRLDLFDPNRLTANARARLFLGSDTALTIGLDALGQRGGNRPTIGIQIRK